ncbi:MAG: DsbA family protein [Nannocystaceae bacterium]|nr:DsbA family protein [bacterium]
MGREDKSTVEPCPGQVLGDARPTLRAPGAHTEDDVSGHARALGLDMQRFASDFAAAQETVELQRESCEAAGAKGTPSFFIGDTVLIGAQPIEAFRKLLD